MSAPGLEKKGGIEAQEKFARALSLMTVAKKFLSAPARASPHQPPILRVSVSREGPAVKSPHGTEELQGVPSSSAHQSGGQSAAQKMMKPL